MISDDDFIDYLLRTAIVWPSIEELRRDFPRWRRFLTEQGVESLSPVHADDPATTNNLMSLLINQTSSISDSATKHRLRDMTHVRPWKGSR